MTDAMLKRRIKCEEEIIRALTLAAMNKGWTPTHVDHDDPVLVHTVDEVVEAVTAVDDCRVFFARNAESEATAWMFFVQGNSGWDVLSDYTTNLDEPVHMCEGLVLLWESRL